MPVGYNVAMKIYLRLISYGLINMIIWVIDQYITDSLGWILVMDYEQIKLDHLSEYIYTLIADLCTWKCHDHEIKE